MSITQQYLDCLLKPLSLLSSAAILQDGSRSDFAEFKDAGSKKLFMPILFNIS